MSFVSRYSRIMAALFVSLGLGMCVVGIDPQSATSAQNGGKATDVMFVPNSEGYQASVYAPPLELEARRASKKLSPNGYVSIYVRCNFNDCDSLKVEAEVTQPPKLRGKKAEIALMTGVPVNSWQLVKLQFGSDAREAIQRRLDTGKNVKVMFTVSGVATYTFTPDPNGSGTTILGVEAPREQYIQTATDELRLPLMLKGHRRK